MPNLVGSGFRLERRLAIAPFAYQACVRGRVLPHDPRWIHQRLHEHVRVLDGHVVQNDVALTLELLDDPHLVGMEVSAAPDPGGVDEADGIEHQRDGRGHRSE